MTAADQEALREIKLRLGIDADETSKDGILLSFLSEIQAKIKCYCNRKNVPDSLYYTVIGMTIDLFRLRDTDNRIVTEETQGNRKLKYAGKNDVDAVLSDYAKELKRFRRVRAV